MDFGWHDEVHLVTTKVVDGPIYPITGNSYTRYSEWIRTQGKPRAEGEEIFFIGEGRSVKIDPRTHGIEVATGKPLKMPLVAIAGGTENPQGSVDVEIPADGEVHVLATDLPVGSWVKRVTDARLSLGPTHIVEEVEDLVVRAHLPGAVLLWVETHDGRGKTVINVTFV